MLAVSWDIGASAHISGPFEIIFNILEEQHQYFEEFFLAKDNSINIYFNQYKHSPIEEGEWLYTE